MCCVILLPSLLPSVLYFVLSGMLFPAYHFLCVYVLLYRLLHRTRLALLFPHFACIAWALHSWLRACPATRFSYVTAVENKNATPTYTFSQLNLRNAAASVCTTRFNRPWPRRTEWFQTFSSMQLRAGHFPSTAYTTHLPRVLRIN